MTEHKYAMSNATVRMLAYSELSLTVDDILLEGGKVAPFSRSESTYKVMGRFGNVLVNGEPELSLGATAISLASQHRLFLDIHSITGLNPTFVRDCPCVITLRCRCHPFDADFTLVSREL